MNKKINNTAICIKISKDLKLLLDKEADELGITTTDYIRIILNNRKVSNDRNK